MTNTVDLAGIQRGLATLDALVEAHPELREPQARARLSAWLTEEHMMATKRRGVFVRMTEDLLERLERYVERLAREQPGTLPTRSDAIRVLLYKGLDTMSEQDAPGRTIGQERRGR